MSESIGVGIITCDRPDFFTKCRDSIDHKSYNHIVVVNDGHDDVVNPRAPVIKTKGREGVGKGKNKILKYLYEKGCDYMFLLEDDMIMLDNSVFNILIMDLVHLLTESKVFKILTYTIDTS